MDRITSEARNGSRSRTRGARVVGVIDLRGGRAVHARGGERASYLPVAEAAGTAIDGDAVALARAYAELGVRELYVADLDAIGSGTGAMQSELLVEIAKMGVPLWVDAGASTLAAAREVLHVGASIVVIGLETLPELTTLEEICSGIGGSRVAFSLDVRGGVAVTPPNAAHASVPPVALASTARRAGVQSIIVLDLARVGTGSRVDLELLASIRRTVPDVALFAGGGVRDASDLTALVAAGCDGALVATALLSGSLTANIV